MVSDNIEKLFFLNFTEVNSSPFDHEQRNQRDSINAVLQRMCHCQHIHVSIVREDVS